MGGGAPRLPYKTRYTLRCLHTYRPPSSWTDRPPHKTLAKFRPILGTGAVFFPLGKPRRKILAHRARSLARSLARLIVTCEGTPWSRRIA